MRTAKLCSLICACALGACAAAAPAPSAVPSVLDPPAGEKRAFAWSGRGVQIYVCKASGATNAQATEAELFDAAGARVGTHGAGPFWQHLDGSKVIGTLKQRSDAPASGAVPWLLLSAKSAGGPGTLAAVTSVQRINTGGGSAPAQGCSAAADAGARARVPYTAEYVFFVSP